MKRAYVAGRCFWCNCSRFRCPSCGDSLILRDVEGHLHMGLCELCGPMDDECQVRTARRENIFGAFDPGLDTKWPG